MEALYAAAASAVPPPITDLLPDLMADDLADLLDLLAQADVYLQDEVELALHPTLARVWCPEGRHGQRAAQTPGTNVKRYGFGAVDWRDGMLDWAVAEGRRAAPFCAQLRRIVARSTALSRMALVILDNLSIHTPKGSRLLREVLAELGDRLVLGLYAALRPRCQSHRVAVAGLARGGHP